MALHLNFGQIGAHVTSLPLTNRLGEGLCQWMLLVGLATLGVSTALFGAALSQASGAGVAYGSLLGAKHLLPPAAACCCRQQAEFLEGPYCRCLLGARGIHGVASACIITDAHQLRVASYEYVSPYF